MSLFLSLLLGSLLETSPVPPHLQVTSLCQCPPNLNGRQAPWDPRTQLGHLLWGDTRIRVECCVYTVIYCSVVGNNNNKKQPQDLFE